jgi:hypothetical protein
MNLEEFMDKNEDEIYNHIINSETFNIQGGDYDPIETISDELFFETAEELYLKQVGE